MDLVDKIPENAEAAGSPDANDSDDCDDVLSLVSSEDGEWDTSAPTNTQERIVKPVITNLFYFLGKMVPLCHVNPTFHLRFCSKPSVVVD
jgi:hypothetical protein